MFEFKIKHSDPKSLARTGTFKTPHGLIQTPVFMPVGTKASVKTLSQADLSTLGAEIILANTYHLYLRPGHKLIKKMGGLHKWMNWQGPILTDSGGFQIFSLSQEKDSNKNASFKTTVKIDENGVEFKSYLDGSKHYFTPEHAIQIQHDLGADIIMAFDECAAAHSSKRYFQQAMTRTHNWLIRCKKEHERLSKKVIPGDNKTYLTNNSSHTTSGHTKNSKEKFPLENFSCQALFGIVQGGLYSDLRTESAKFVNALDFPGNAIGGLSVGEGKDKMLEMIETVIPHLSEQKPRYLMGVGTPEDLLECVERGVDMFDCVHVTRMSRHGAFWTEKGRFTIRSEKFKTDASPLQKGCPCETCTTYSRSYLRHLMFENEILGLRLMTVHNLHFLLNLMTEMRQHIEKGDFLKFKKNFLKKFSSASNTKFTLKSEA